MKKRVTFAYPGSRWARLSGCSGSGCYVVVLSDSQQKPSRLIKGGFPSLEAAIVFADRLPYPYHEETKTL